MGTKAINANLSYLYWDGSLSCAENIKNWAASFGVLVLSRQVDGIARLGIESLDGSMQMAAPGDYILNDKGNGFSTMAPEPFMVMFREKYLPLDYLSA